MYSRIYKVSTAFLAAFIVTSCGFLGIGGEFLTEFPPEVLDVPVNDNVEETAFYHESVDINESNVVIGYTNSSGAYVNSGYDSEIHPVAGYAINVDDTGFVDVSAKVTGSTGSWPLDISDAGVIVGTYIVKISEDNYALRAYSINADGTGYVELHPDGEVSSRATNINENGRIFGTLEDEFDSEAVEFSVDGAGVAQATALLPGYFYSKVQATNDTWVVIHANETDQADGKLYLYTIADGTFSELIIPEVSSDEAIIEAIKEDGTMVGWYIDLDDVSYSLDEVGFTYTIGDAAPETYLEQNTIGEWTYIWYRFMDFDSDGTIVGIGSRIGPEAGLPQSRAIRLEWDFTGFEDITPENAGAYSEATGITEDGWATGYAGFAFAGFFGGFETVRNASFAVKIK